jgi:hypothetical protein
MPLLTILVFLLAVIALVLLVLVRKLTGPATVAECDPDWISNFSVARYRPMMRILDDTDYKFLECQPGYSKKFVQRLRSQRRAIFRAYLRNLVRDFHRLHLAARMVLIYAPQDRPDLAMTLVKQRLLFTFAIISVEYRLILHGLGLGTVDVRNLLGALDHMRANVVNLNPDPLRG